MTLIASPLDPIIHSVPLSRVAATARAVSFHTFDVETIAFAGKKFLAVIETVPLNAARAQALEAFFAALNGDEYSFLLSPKRVRHGTGGTVLVAGPAQTGAVINVNGMAPGQTGVLKAGDYCSFGNRLYQLRADLDADGAGAGTLALWPSVRVAPADGASVEVDAPQGEFRLMSGETPSIGPVPGGFTAPIVFNAESVQ